MTKEMKLQYVIKECIEDLQRIDIQVGKIVSVSVNSRAKSRWGRCIHNNGYYSLQINSVLLEDTTDIMALKNTVFHELLHTCKNCLNHGKEWKALAEKVNRAYGTNIKRCTSASEKGLDDFRTANIKYAFRCKECGQMVYRQRMSDFVKHYEFYQCGACGGKFEKLK